MLFTRSHRFVEVPLRSARVLCATHLGSGRENYESYTTEGRRGSTAYRSVPLYLSQNGRQSSPENTYTSSEVG